MMYLRCPTCGQYELGVDRALLHFIKHHLYLDEKPELPDIERMGL